jgi:hypothetical protein
MMSVIGKRVCTALRSFVGGISEVDSKSAISERVTQILSAPRGSADWLIHHELQYGGLVQDVPRRKVSPYDSRTKEQLRSGGMIGGDRFLHHGYGQTYAEELERFCARPPHTVVEIGILRGTGLAVWCDLFPDARVVGLDTDLTHYRENIDNLVERGAFSRNRPEVYEFDQLAPDEAMLRDLFSGQGVDIVIDDGLHSDPAIKATFGAVRPYLVNDWLYIIEDSLSAAELIAGIAPELSVRADRELTVVAAT